PAVGVGRLMALLILAWLLVAGAGLALQLLAGQPLVLCLLGLWIFYGGFRLLEDPGKATLGLLVLIVFAIVPQSVSKAPELSSDFAYWFGLNFAIAATAEWITRWLLP